MYELVENSNSLFESEIEIEGSSYDKSYGRLIISPTGKSDITFIGKVDSEGKLEIPIKDHKLSPKDLGDIFLEVIIEDRIFFPWNSKFTVKSDTKVVSNKTALNEEVIESPTSNKVDIKPPTLLEYFKDNGLTKSRLKEKDGLDIIISKSAEYVKQYHIPLDQITDFESILEELPS